MALHDPEDAVCRIDGTRALVEQCAVADAADKELVEVVGGLHDLTSNEPALVVENLERELSWDPETLVRPL